MTRRKTGWAVIGMIAAGCQAPSTSPAPVPAVSAPTQAPAVAPAKQASLDPRVVAAMKQIEQHTQTINEADFEPPPGARPTGEASPKPTPSRSQQSPPKPATPRPDPAAEAFKPVKPIDKLIEEQVSFTPTGEPPAPTKTPTAVSPPVVPPARPPLAQTPATPTPVMPPAEVVAPPAVVAPQVVAPPVAAVVPPPGGPPAELSGRLDAKARSAPGDFAAQVDAQLARILVEQPPAKADTMSALEPEDRDVLLSVVDGLTNFRAQVQRDPNLLPNKKIRPLLDMADRLRAKADLAIVNPCLAKQVRGFGSYDAIDPLRLPAGVAHRPAIYYEIENFSSRIDDKGLYRTTLRQDVVIYDIGGAAVWQWPNQPVIDLCRRQRHDLYFASLVRVPINLPAGTYTIKITLTDAQRMAETSLPLVITPAPNVAPVQPRVGAPAGPVAPGAPAWPGGIR